MRAIAGLIGPTALLIGELLNVYLATAIFSVGGATLSAVSFLFWGSVIGMPTMSVAFLARPGRDCMQRPTRKLVAWAAAGSIVGVAQLGAFLWLLNVTPAPIAIAMGASAPLMLAIRDAATGRLQLTVLAGSAVIVFGLLLARLGDPGSVTADAIGLALFIAVCSAVSEEVEGKAREHGDGAVFALVRFIALGTTGAFLAGVYLVVRGDLFLASSSVTPWAALVLVLHFLAVFESSTRRVNDKAVFSVARTAAIYTGARALSLPVMALLAMLAPSAFPTAQVSLTVMVGGLAALAGVAMVVLGSSKDSDIPNNNSVNPRESTHA